MRSVHGNKPAVCRQAKTTILWMAALGLAMATGAAAFMLRGPITEWMDGPDQIEPADGNSPGQPGASDQVTLSAQARGNLNLASKPLKPVSYWKTIDIPGMVIDRPGFSDRGVVAPATGVISRIHHQAGTATKPGEGLFTIKLLSESLHQTQSELFKAVQDIRLARSQRERLAAAAGAVAEARIIDADNQITRLEVGAKAYRTELVNRGLTREQIDGIAEGRFISEIVVTAPERPAVEGVPANAIDHYEIQEIRVELGQQVQAGQTLCLLSNHQLLSIEGRAFRDETVLLERAAREGWPVGIDMGETAGGDWPPLEPFSKVTYISNSIDPESRTFRFLLPLENQSKTVEVGGRRQWLWRFRPGQRVRLLVRFDRVDDVFVLPAAAVAREGPEAYVFRRNGDSFDRKPVRLIHLDRRDAVIANDGAVPPGIHVAQTGAAQLNRMLKGQSGTAPKGFHVHADGSVHYGSHE